MGPRRREFRPLGFELRQPGPLQRRRLLPASILLPGFRGFSWRKDGRHWLRRPHFGRRDGLLRPHVVLVPDRGHVLVAVGGTRRSNSTTCRIGKRGAVPYPLRMRRRALSIILSPVFGTRCGEPFFLPQGNLSIRPAFLRARTLSSQRARAAVLAEFSRCARRALRCAQILRTSGLIVRGAEGHGLAFRITDAAAPVGRSAFVHDPGWAAAIAALRDDADAPPDLRAHDDGVDAGNTTDAARAA